MPRPSLAGDDTSRRTDKIAAGAGAARLLSCSGGVFRTPWATSGLHSSVC